MLPTLAVILWAYGMYALFSFILQRKGGQPRGQSRWRKLTGFILVGGIVGLGLILWCCYSPDKTDQRLKLAGFLGTVYAEGWPDRVDKVEYPPVKASNQGTGEQPAYALLHPETPASQIEPEKKLIRPRPSRVAKKQTSGVHEKSGKTAKVAKTVTPSSKKDKMAAKSRAKKKKRSSTNAG
ncbi:MAG: hypothetical protein ACYC6G_15630 [Desulfobaccales bacterium]